MSRENPVVGKIMQPLTIAMMQGGLNQKQHNEAREVIDGFVRCGHTDYAVAHAETVLFNCGMPWSRGWMAKTPDEAEVTA